MTERFSNKLNNFFFRSSEDLTITKNNYNILLIGSCYIDYLYNCYKKIYPDNKYYYYTESTNIDKNIRYDFMVSNYALRFVEFDCNYFKLIHTEDNLKNFFDECLNRLCIETDKNIKLAKNVGIPFFCIGYIVPQFPTMGRIMKKHSLQNHQFFIKKLNEGLEEYLLNNKFNYDNCYYVDAEASASTYGKKRFLDDTFFVETHNSIGYDANYELDLDRMDKYIGTFPRLDPVTPIHFESLCVEITFMYRTLQRTDEIKLVIFDLDGTLWRGVPAENNIYTNEGWPAGIHEAILTLYKRGIILAICSKNDEKYIENNWNSLVNNRVPYDIFSIKKINFDDKIKNIESIINTVNILPSNILFVDDNPRERESVKRAFPQIRVIGEDVIFWKKCLLTSSELQPIIITNESLNKGENIKNMEKKEEIKKNMSNEEFLESLNLKLKYVKSSEIHLNRIFELFNKTNQFNSIGKRYTKDEIKELINNENIYHGEVSDKYVDYGIVISCIMKDNCINHLVMSCRVFNLSIENVFIIIIMNLYNVNDIINIQFKMSDKNKPCLDSLKNIGFNMENVSDVNEFNENNCIKEYLIYKSIIKNIPSHISIIIDL